MFEKLKRIFRKKVEIMDIYVNKNSDRIEKIIVKDGAFENGKMKKEVEKILKELLEFENSKK